jgi:membrane associated rhomboid family serine protease
VNINLLLIISIGLVSYLSFSNQALFSNLLFSPYQIVQKKEWYRFLTSAWLHADFMHLFINLFVLFSFGNYLERYLSIDFGNSAGELYLILFLGSTIIAHLPAFIKFKNNFNYSAIGASGGVSGVLFAYIIINPMSMLQLYLFIPIPAIVFGLLYLCYSYYMSKKNIDNIGHDAHLYGAIGGMGILTVFKPTVWGGFLQQILALF